MQLALIVSDDTKYKLWVLVKGFWECTSSAGQCTATDCNVEGLVRVSLGVAGLLWLVAVCGDVGLRDCGEFDRNAGMCGWSAENPLMDVGVGLIGTGIAGKDCPP